MSENQQTAYDYFELDTIFVGRCKQCGNKPVFYKSGGWICNQYSYSVSCGTCNLSHAETVQQKNALEPLEVLERVAIEWNIKQGIHREDAMLIQSRYAAYAKMKEIITLADDPQESLQSNTFI
ncbi:hypothetical protein [Alteromonas gracilis]|uniref:hypothetical protein n=1 Tax=Alteromonas gracilis TaxID=1479524 RepID=UPI0030D361A1